MADSDGQSDSIGMRERIGWSPTPVGHGVRPGTIRTRFRFLGSTMSLAPPRTRRVPETPLPQRISPQSGRGVHEKGEVLFPPRIRSSCRPLNGPVRGQVRLDSRRWSLAGMSTRTAPDLAEGVNDAKPAAASPGFPRPQDNTAVLSFGTRRGAGWPASAPACRAEWPPGNGRRSRGDGSSGS